MYKVIKPFISDSRRFSLEQRIYRNESATLFPHTLESLIEGGFVANELAAQSKPKPTKPEEPVLTEDTAPSA